MSYLVMARKYRPTTFAELVGQDHVVRTLQNAISKSRLSHAYIFSGPRGVGKTTTARLLAKAVNCQAGPATEPCNKCASCREIGEGRSLDVLEIDAASNTGVDNIRDLRDNVKFAPSRDRFKVYIIDEFHMLSTAAFNALLKTLEEPPAHVKFIMATTAPDKVPATIQSRCQRFDFRLLTRVEIAEQLAALAAKEGLTVGREALGQVARAAEGSLRDAQVLLEQVVAFAGDEPAEKVVEEVLHLVTGDVLERFLRAVAGRDAAELIRIIDELAARGFDMRRFLDELLEWLRGLVLISVSPALADLVPLVEEDRKTIGELASGFSRGRLQALLEVAMDAERELKSAPNPRYAMEVAALRMVETADFDTLAGLTRRLEELSGGGGRGAGDTVGGETDGQGAGALREAAAGPARPAEKASPGGSGVQRGSAAQDPAAGEEEEPGDMLELTGEDVPPADDWGRFLERVKKRKMGLGSFLEHGSLVSRDGKSLVVAFSGANKFFLESAQEKDHLAILNEAAAAAFGPGCRVRLELAAEPPEGAKKPPRTTDLAKKKEREALKNPLVQDILDRFGGQVTDVHVLRTLREEGG